MELPFSRGFGNNHGCRAQEAFTEFEAFAELLEDVAFGDVWGFLLGNGFVVVGIKWLARRIDFFEAGVSQGLAKLLLDHGDALLEGVGVR